jgi:nitroreductase
MFVQARYIMDIFETIRQRRSIRSYTDEEVTEEEITTLLEAAIRAPSACDRQTWRFVIVRRTQTVDILYRAASYSTQHQTFVKKAPVIIVVCADIRPYKRTPYRERGESLFALQETAAAIQNLLLAACALNLAACWVGLIDEEVIKQALKIPKGVRPVAIIPIGHTKSKTKPTARKPLEEVVYQETF